MLFGALITVIGGFLTAVLTVIAEVVGAVLLTLVTGLLLTTSSIMPTIGPWLTMPWIPWIALGHCTTAMFLGWLGSFLIAFIVKYALPLITMGWVKL